MTDFSSELIIDSCPHCLSDFSDKCEYERHAEKCKRFHDQMSDTAMSVCGLCPFSTPHEEDLKAHLVNHHGQIISSESFLDGYVAQCIKDTTCIVCGTVFKSGKEVAEHVQEKHAAILEKLRRKSLALAKDPLNITADTSSPTAIAKKSAPTYVNDKSISPSKAKCPKCSRSIPRRSLNSHVALCQTFYDKIVDDTTCGICSENFESNQMLYGHFAQAHKKEDMEADWNVKKFKSSCKNCGRDFARKSSLTVHMKSCNGGNKENQILKDADSSISDSIEMDDSPQEENGSALLKIRDERSLSSTPQLNISGASSSGPELVTKVFGCPLCSGKLMTFRDAQDHLAKFHQVSIYFQSMLAAKGVAITEVKL